MKKEFEYAAFISYSHHLDHQLATALQAALHKLGKPWYKLRQLNVFRDETDLSATPDLWAKIEDALVNSDYLILMASHLSAGSKWVQKELEFWFDNKDVQKIIIVRSDGNLNWESGSGDFDWTTTTCIPKIFSGKFRGEPLHIDFTEVRKGTDYSLQNPSFKFRIAQISAAIQNISLKELIDLDIKEYRKTIKIRNSAITIISILLIVAFIASLVILKQRNSAQTIAESNEHVVMALNKNSVTQSLAHVYKAYTLNPSPYVANLLNQFGQNPVTFFNIFDVTDTVGLLSFAPGNDTIYTGHEAGILKAWSNSGILLKSVQLSMQGIDNILPVPSKNLLVIYGYNNQADKLEVDVLDRQTLTQVNQFFIASNPRSVHLSPYNQLIVASDDNTISVVYLDGTIKDIPYFNEDKVLDVYMTRDNEFIALLENETNNQFAIKRYNPQGKENGFFHFGQQASIACITYHAPLHLLLAIAPNGTAYIWDSVGYPKFTNKLNIPVSAGIENDLTFEKPNFSPSGHYYSVVVNDNGFIQTLNGSQTYIASILADRLGQINFSNTEGQFYSFSNYNGMIYNWDFRGNLIQKKDYPNSDQIVLANNTPEFIVRQGNMLMLYQLNNNKPKQTWYTNIDYIKSFSVIGNDSLIIWGNSCFEVIPISQKKAAPVITCLTDQKIYHVDVNHHKIYSATEKGILAVHDYRYKTEKLLTVEPDINFIKTNSKGEVLVGGGAVSKNGFLQLFTDELKLKKTFTDLDEPINDAVFTTDKIFLTVDDAGSLKKWNISDTIPQITRQISTGISMDITGSPECKYFITNGMIANELILLDQHGNKIQSTQTKNIATDFFIINEDCYQFVCEKSVYKNYTPTGFIKSGRIASLKKIEKLEEGSSPFSVHDDLRKALTLDKNLY